MPAIVGRCSPVKKKPLARVSRAGGESGLDRGYWPPSSIPLSSVMAPATASSESSGISAGSKAR